MHSMKIGFVVLLAVALCAGYSHGSSSFQWGQTAAAYVIKDQNNNSLPCSSTIGTAGAWAQLIYAGANATTNDFSFTGLGVSGDDVVIDVNYSANGTFMGWGPGKWSYQPAGTNDIPNGNYYVRVYNSSNDNWAMDTNAPFPSTATYYWQSQMHAYSYTLPTDGVDQWNFTDAVAGIQTLTPIPEPATFALISLGLAVVGLRKRRR